jgi:hypothetical protein
MKRIALGLTLVALVALGWSRSPRATRAPQNPLGTIALPLASPMHMRAVVRERIAVGSYSYLRLTDARGADAWFVTVRGRNDPSASSCVEVTAYARAERFESARLARTFAPLLFGSAHRCP